MQPTRGIGQQHVDLSRTCRLDRIEYYSCRIGAGLLCDDGDVVALPPRLQLLDRRGAKRIACGQHDSEAIVNEFLRELADRRGLAGTVDADHENDERSIAVRNLEPSLDRRKDVDERRAQAFAQCGRVVQFLSPKALTESRDDIGGRLNPDVSHNQRRFEFLQGLLVDPAAGCQVRQVVGEPAVATVEPGSEPFDESFARGSVRTLDFSKHEFPPSEILK